MAPVDSYGIDSPVNQTAQLVGSVITFSITLIAVIATLALCRKERIAWPLLVLVSGTVTFLLEPLYDHLYGLWFQVQGQWNAVVTYDIHIPIWLPGIYVAYYGACTIFFWYRLHRGANMRDVAIHYTISVILAGLAEQFYINGVHLYNYQDHQPFFIFNYPIFVAVINGVPPMLAGIVYYRLVPLLEGWSKLVLLAVVPICFATNSFGSGFLYLALRHASQRQPMFVLSLGALTCVAGSVGVIWIAAKLAGVGSKQLAYAS
ncbi:MAG TPA: hypothetical protein VGH89_12205 [Pseudonocardia sp.]|jgi:hypothetical protein